MNKFYHFTFLVFLTIGLLGILNLLRLALIDTSSSNDKQVRPEPVEKTVDTDTYKQPNVVAMPASQGYGYSYLIDEDTGVVYLEYDNLNRYAITVMLKPDGTPVLKDDIIVKKDNETSNNK